MAGFVVLFDFDKTIIDVDSDDWVVAELGVAELFHRLMPTMPLNPLMDGMMKEVHSQGKTVEDIVDCLKRAPLDHHVINAIKSARALGCDLRVVSDANLLFIEAVLKHHGILQCFSEINTNPCYVDENGRLRILPYHDSVASPHGCSLCPPNMCKSKIVERIQAQTSSEGKRFVYLGDGKGDYCPSLRLDEGDYLMPRKDYPLWNLIYENGQILKAKVHEWQNGEELQAILLQLIGGSTSGAVSEFVSMECKLKLMPIATNEAHPQALPVPH